MTMLCSFCSDIHLRSMQQKFALQTNKKTFNLTQIYICVKNDTFICSAFVIMKQVPDSDVKIKRALQSIFRVSTCILEYVCILTPVLRSLKCC